MAQPYDKTGGGGKKTLLSQEDLEKMVEGSMNDMLYWGVPVHAYKLSGSDIWVAFISKLIAYAGLMLTGIKKLSFWSDCCLGRIHNGEGYTLHVWHGGF